MAGAVAQAFNGDLGEEPPAGPRYKAPGQGARGQSPPEAEALLAFGRTMEVTNLAIFLKFGSAKKSDICLIFAKNHRWPQKWRGPGAKLGGPVPPPGPGLKPSLGICLSRSIIRLTTHVQRFYARKQQLL